MQHKGVTDYPAAGTLAAITAEDATMTDLPEILPRGDSPEYVAYMLLCHIALAEEKRIGPQAAGPPRADSPPAGPPPMGSPAAGPQAAGSQAVGSQPDAPK